MILADKIIDLRKKAGWSQEELAEKTGISPVMISKYMSEKATPSGHTIHRLARALGCTVAELTDF